MTEAFSSRPYGEPDDLNAMQAFLRRVRPAARLADYPGLTDLRELAAQPDTLAYTRLWFEPAGQMAGFAWASEYNSLHIEPDPACGPELEQAMLDWVVPLAQRLAAERGEDEAPRIACRLDDSARLARLAQSGFRRLDEGVVHLARRLDAPIPAPALPPGFTIRPWRGESELEAWVVLHRAAFGTEHMTAAYRRAMAAGPDYDPEMDLVAVAPDGRLAAYAVGSYPVEENALTGQAAGYADPLATHPDFQGRGLATALLLEAARRLQARGAERVCYGTASDNLAMQAAGRKAGFALEYETIWLECPEEKNL